MREASFVIPTSKPASLAVLHAFCRDAADRFGGYTVRTGSGGRINDAGKLIEEPNATVVVAMEPNAGNCADFRRMCEDAGRRLGEDAIYVRLPTGEVEIVSVARHAALAA